MDKRPSTKSAKRRSPQTKGSAEDAIRRRAYELYQERGGAPGGDVGDWLRAEREIRSHRAKRR